MKTNVRAKKLVQTAKGKAREELDFVACSYRMAGSVALGHGFSIVLGSAWISPVCLGVLRIAELVGLTYSRVYSRHSFSGKTKQCEQDDGDMCGHPRTSNTK